MGKKSRRHLKKLGWLHKELSDELRFKRSMCRKWAEGQSPMKRINYYPVIVERRLGKLKFKMCSDLKETKVFFSQLCLKQEKEQGKGKAAAQSRQRILVGNRNKAELLNTYFVSVFYQTQNRAGSS